MDLALHLGMTADGLSRFMTERELRDWQRYADRRMLPWRRIEMYLAQIAQWVVWSGGGKDAKLRDFLFQHVEEPDASAAPEEITVDDVVAQFGGRVYKKRST